MEALSTLCYIEKDGHYLMLHRVKKKADINDGKWLGIGGHFEENESPDECLIREVREETGLTLTSFRLRGIVTFVSGKGATEYMFLFTASADISLTDPLPECSEGDLAWIPIEKIKTLPIWEGDAVFLDLLAQNAPFFLLKLVYDENDVLTEAILDGKFIMPNQIPF